MNTLYDWRARRSASTMTITGKDKSGDRVKLRYVDTIESDLPDSIATTLDGVRWRLSCHPCPSGTAQTPSAA